MGPVGVQEMIVILLVALVLFGPKKLPELGKTIGKAMTEFRRAQAELKATFDSHMRELEKESDSKLRAAIPTKSTTTTTHTSLLLSAIRSTIPAPNRIPSKLIHPP
jgi:TatA/E family protein of Tat protein translocase